MVQDPLLYSAYRRGTRGGEPLSNLDGQAINTMSNGRPTSALGGYNSNNENHNILVPPSTIKRAPAHGSLSTRPSMIPQFTTSVRQSIASAAPRPSFAGHSNNNNMTRSQSGTLLMDTGNNMTARLSSTNRNSYAAGGTASSKKPGNSGSSAPTPFGGSQTRRSSSLTRKSSIAPINNNGGANGLYSSIGTGSIITGSKDPRALRDKSYQNAIAQRIQDYLSQRGFEVEMKHPLTQRTLRSPTQKDFIFVFQFLYHQLDPGYKFTKSIDSEVIFLLKTIRYPYVELLSKKKTTAVGGQNWPLYLGMLYWLVELCESMEKYDSKHQDDKLEQNPVEFIFFKFVLSAYKSFLAGEEDFSAYEVAMEQEFEREVESMVQETQEIEQENEHYQSRFDDLSKHESAVYAVQTKVQTLEDDLARFRPYVQNMEKRKPKWTSVIENINKDLNEHEELIKDLQNEKQSLQSKISKQGFSPVDIDRMHSERDKFMKTLESIQAKLDSASKVAQEHEAEAQRAFDELDRATQMYSSMGYKIGVLSLSSASSSSSSPRPLSSSEGNKFEITLPSSLSEPLPDLRPEAILGGVDIRHQVRPKLQQLRKEISQRVHASQDETIRLQEELDRLTEQLSDKRDRIDTFEAKLRSTKTEYDELHETMAADASASHAEIEKLERELQTMKINSQTGVLQLEQKCQTAEIEYDRIKRSIQESRDKMSTEVDKLIQYLLSFRLHVQSSLEEYENFILGEMEFEAQAYTSDQIVQD